jgi:hypothetical protein
VKEGIIRVWTLILKLTTEKSKLLLCRVSEETVVFFDENYCFVLLYIIMRRTKRSEGFTEKIKIKIFFKQKD